METTRDDLIKVISTEKKETGSHDRYPVRFLFMPLQNNTIDDIGKLIIEFNLKAISISEYFPEDKWRTWDSLQKDLVKEIKSTSKDIVFTGLSEYLRFFSKEEIESIFINLISLENSADDRRSKKRTYFVIDSFLQQFSEIVEKNHHRNIFYNPIITGTIKRDPDSPSYIVNPRLSITRLFPTQENRIPSVKKYLDIPKDSQNYDFSKELICSSETILSLAKKNKSFLSDPFFPYKVVDKKSELITEKIQDFPKSDSLEDDDEFCSWLISKLITDPDSKEPFDSFFERVTKADPDKLLEVLFAFFKTSDSNLKKLFKLFFSCNDRKETSIDYGFVSYLFDCHTRISTKNDFVEQLYLSCADSTVLEVFYKTRIDLINAIFKEAKTIEAPDTLENCFDSQLTVIARKRRLIDSNSSMKIDSKPDGFAGTLKESIFEEVKDEFYRDFILKVVTSCSAVEQKIIVALFSSGYISDEVLEKLYPELFAYVYYHSDNHEANEFLDEYFLEYRKSKLGNAPTDVLKSHVSKITPSTFFDFYKDPKYEHIKIDVDVNYIFVFDGVGAEYLSLLSYLLEVKHSVPVTVSDYRKALLPTITHINRGLIDKLLPTPIWDQDFDSEIIHGEYYEFRKNTQKALALLDKMVTKAVEKASGRPFVIIADHGCTAAHKIFSCSKTYQCFSNAEHDGRCCKIEKEIDPSPTDHFAVYKDDAEIWAISIDGTSLHNTSKYEAHGGGTIEEMFVPFIYCGGDGSKEDYSISFLKDSVTGLDKSIKFVISPMPTNRKVVVVEANGTEMEAIFSENTYIANLSAGRSQTITIKIGKTFKDRFEIKSAGMSTNKGGFF